MFPAIHTRHIDGFLRGAAMAAGLAVSLFAAPLAHAQDASAASDIVQFAFQPGALQVPVGTTVTWTNHDSIVHSVTNGTPDAPGAAFDSGLFDLDQTYSFTFSDVGDFTYFCTRHNFMRGTVSVSPA